MGFLMNKGILEFKDSKIAWIGQIPKHWEVKKLKYVLNERKENNKPIKTDFILSLTNEKGVIPYGEKGAQGNISKDDLSGYKIAYPNDIVLNSMNVVIGSVGLSKYYGAISPVYYALYEKQGSNIKFYNYIFQTSVFQNSLKGLGNGILEIRMRIPMSNLNNVYLPVPPLAEQERIAEFLDKKCASIDSSIENLEQKTKSLAQYKKALITQCVTKGLNPKILEFKDSEIPWIRQIPKHWEISKIKYVAKIRSENSSFNTENDKYIGLENVAGYLNSLIETNTEYENSIQAVCKKGDILFGKLRPYLSKVIIAPFNCFCSSEFLQFINLKCYFKFFYYFLLNKNFIENVNSSTYGAKMPRANSNYIMNLNFLVPPLNEQKEIAEFLDNKCEKIDRLNENYTKQIATLKEYKKSLIYECVTGKKEI